MTNREQATLLEGDTEADEIHRGPDHPPTGELVGNLLEIRAGEFFDMMVLPERDHHYGYTGKGRPWHERIHFAELIRRHFQKYLPPALD